MTRYDWSTSREEVKWLRDRAKAARADVITHPIYTGLDTLSRVNTFTENHIFAVWDFMSLLKALQRELTCVDIPWQPRGSRTSRRLINEIVLIEESDELGGEYVSHFELYLNGMKEAGANTGPIECFIEALSRGQKVTEALNLAGVAEPAVEFVKVTWGFIDNASLHERAAAFAFGREDLIPDMFQQIIKVDDRGGRLSIFKEYLSRHIQVDSEEHTPMAIAMLVDLCADDKAKWEECATAVDVALSARRALWDGIAELLQL